MSRDSQAGKESRTQRNPDNPRIGRRQGGPSLSEKAAYNDQEVIQIPEDKVGHVIGRKGKRKRDVMERSGVQALDIKGDQVRIKGTEEQRTKAITIIHDIIRVRLGKMPPFSEFFFPCTALRFFSSAYLPVCQSTELPFCLCVCVCLCVGLSACLPVPVYSSDWSGDAFLS